MVEYMCLVLRITIRLSPRGRAIDRCQGEEQELLTARRPKLEPGGRRLFVEAAPRVERQGKEIYGDYWDIVRELTRDERYGQQRTAMHRKVRDSSTRL